MPILVKGKSPPTVVLCVREIRVGIPRERLGQLERFYTAILGLIPWPKRCQIPGGWGLGNPQTGLLLQFRHDPVIDPLRRRFTLMVDGLAMFEQRLRDEQWPYQRVHGFGWTDQYLLLHDPAGHLIEVRQSQPF